MRFLDWRFFPIADLINPTTAYPGAYNPGLVALSVVVATLAAFVALSISGRIVAANLLEMRGHTIIYADAYYNVFSNKGRPPGLVAGMQHSPITLPFITMPPPPAVDLTPPVNPSRRPCHAAMRSRYSIEADCLARRPRLSLDGDTAQF